MERFKVINGTQMKLLMVFLMVLDHLHYIYGLIPSSTASIFTIISRCVAPMFAYLAVEGVRHTHNLKKYCLRLSVLAGVMFIGNMVLNATFRIYSGMLSDVELKLLYCNNNVIFTLALGVIMITLVQQGENQTKAKRKWFYLLGLVCFVTGFLWGEWGSVLMPFMLVEYLFHENRTMRLLGYGTIEIIALLLPFGEPLYFLVFPFIVLYNGERGKSSVFSKYFFYIFYPVHLWLIAAVNFIVMMS